MSRKKFFKINLFIFNWRMITILYWFLPYTNMNQPLHTYVCRDIFSWSPSFRSYSLIWKQSNMTYLIKNPYFTVHLSTSNNLFLYSCYFILSLGLCSNLLETLYASHSLFNSNIHFYHLIGNTEPYLTEVSVYFSFACLLSRSVVSNSLRACGR